MRTFDIGKFDLNLLRALHMLLRERNVTRAANELHVTQQAMSGSLKRLRQHFDDPLFIRVGQHLEPTPMVLIFIES
ncbi:helix-turn-helix domain-containing protein [Sphingobium fluviale]|uniref:helix-turn-helix domain-containing protein n=1 Tax=Sphingobium fluviale TaxID=2506423 RepID=UPI001FE880EE|nr:LysR family transcriptional regulator [Sphingobium fluviale]